MNRTLALFKEEPPLLHIRDLTIEAETGGNWRPIVSGANLSVRRGEVIGLIGESGAGKSSLGLAAMGILRPGCRISAGSIIFDGLELTRIDERSKRLLRGTRITYVAQSAAASFNPAYRLMNQVVETVVSRSLLSRREAEVSAERIFAELRLPQPKEIGHRFPHQVSGGQLQRVMTGMAMISKPDLIIFDEPTTALDVSTQVEVLATIREMVRKTNTAGLYITHDLAVVTQMADRVVVLKGGVIVEEAPTLDMITTPRDPYTRSLWAVQEVTPPPIEPNSLVDAPSLSLEAVSAWHGPHRVLSGINVSFRQKEIVAVVGESGSGKSTLGRLIAGLHSAMEGSIMNGDVHLSPKFYKRTIEQLRSVQLVHQSPDSALNPRHTVKAILERPLKLYFGMGARERRLRVCELLEAVELQPETYLDRRPSELSGGQKQRLCIARAIAADPQFIVCDEVTSGLDQIVAAGVLRLLIRLRRERELGVIFITHDLATVRAIADRVLVMKAGRVVESGLKEEVIGRPRTEETKALLSSVPEIDPSWLDRILAERGQGRLLSD